jgi:DDE family transposase
MPHDQALYQWNDRLATHFPELPAAHRGWLATASFGIALARCAAVSAVALQLAPRLGLALTTARQRLRELYQPAAVKAGHRRQDFDPTTCFGPLLRWATAGSTDRRLAVALDPTDLAGRFLVLTISVVSRSCAIPVAWHVQPIHGVGSWNDRWKRLLGELRDRRGDGWEVLVLTDRGLESPELFRAIAAPGWHPLMRVKARGKFRPAGWHRGYPMGQFAAAVGRRWKGAGRAYPGGSKLPGTLLACWEAGHEGPWLVLTELAPAAAEVGWYAWRSWIEQGFKRLKSGGWQLERNRMTDPERVARWWAAVAVATLWALEVGGGDAALGWAGGLMALAAVGLSLFRLGACWLQQALMEGREAPRGRWHAAAWPIDPRPSDPLQEQDLCQTAGSLPL